MSTSKVKRKWT